MNTVTNQFCSLLAIASTAMLPHFVASTMHAQAVPSPEENIPFIVTFGKDANPSWGDDDNSQVFFFAIPEGHASSVYVRIFDADCGGQNDEPNKAFNTTTSFSIYGGRGCVTDKDARGSDPVGNYASGNLLLNRKFSNQPEFDGQWCTLGPINPHQGELEPSWGGYIFKVIATGMAGDDGNLYRYYLSTEPTANKAVEGSNWFTFEYSFRMPSDGNQICHLYPFVDNNLVSIKQSNFDWDSYGTIAITSTATFSQPLATSSNKNWASDVYMIRPSERQKSLDIQFARSKSNAIRNNSLVFNVANQYGENIAFFSSPIGGKPVLKIQALILPKG